MGEFVSFQNPDDADLRALLKKIKNIAVLGLSPKPDRPSNFVARAMQDFGFNIIPVRPATAEILGKKTYASLRDIPDPVDLADVFRAAEYLDAIVDECIALQLPAIWIQEGIVNEAAAERARAAGMTVVMDRCIYKDYVALCQ